MDAPMWASIAAGIAAAGMMAAWAIRGWRTRRQVARIMEAIENDELDAVKDLAWMRRCPLDYLCYAQARSGLSPLMAAASTGNVVACSLLLDAGADPNFRSRSGRTALTYAKTPAVAETLLKRGADLRQ